jgi:hypothetical protein
MSSRIRSAFFAQTPSGAWNASTNRRSTSEAGRAWSVASVAGGGNGVLCHG